MFWGEGKFVLVRKEERGKGLEEKKRKLILKPL